MSQPAPQLEYGHTRRRRKGVVKWVLIALLAMACWPLGRAASNYYSARQPFVALISQCGQLSTPAGTVVYVDQAQASSIAPVPGYTVKHDGDGYGQYRNGFLFADVYAELGRAGGSGVGGYEAGMGPTLFVHQRTSAQGRPAVVAIALNTDRTHFRLYITVVEPMGYFEGDRPKCYTSGGNLGHWPARTVPVTFFAGQPDPKDASRFTIPYQIGDQSGVIDGVLNNDLLTVTLTPRTGPLATSPTTQKAE